MNASDNNNATSTIWDRLSVGWQGIDDPSCEIASLLARVRPYAVSLDEISIRYTSPELERDIMSEERLCDAINGSIVGLCCRGDDAAMAVRFPCVGLGIVRSIDRIKRLLYILTPVPEIDMRSVNCLTVGSNVHLPIEFFFLGVCSDSFPYITFESDNACSMDVFGADPMKSRKNISRRGQISSGG